MNIKKIHVLISAYTANNLGDDMFITLLCNHYPHVDFILQCPKTYSQAFKDLSNLTIIYELSNQLKNCIDFQIFIGGSLFMEPQDISKIESKFQSVISCRLSPHIPFFVIGANFGPYTQELHLNLYKQWFSQLDGVCFRDKQSWKLFSHFPKVMWAPDLLFCYPLPTHSCVKNNITIAPIYNTGRIGLSDFSNEEYFSFQASIACEYLKNGYSVTLASLCEAQLDNIACKEIYNKIPNELRENVFYINYQNDIDNFLIKLLSTGFVIGTRFHSIILSLKAKIPVFPIIYNKKTANIIRDYEFKGIHADITQLKQFSFNDIDSNRKMPYIPNYSLYDNYATLHFHYFNEALIEKECL